MGKHHATHHAPSVEVDEKTMQFLTKFMNTATKEKLTETFEGHVTDHMADLIVDQRLFGGLKQLDDILEKKIMRKKHFEAFQDVALQWAVEHKPKEKRETA
ncbi:hypothetical protein SPRG_18437 [Saprolegnia parasitica CBS 223.65]|uniref:Uncharacterized protein n=1 Tax=Saprolegnia parasitica (strain CBS 223.65) TaxID=695850 RepID=A0A067BD30_SAPPC|nr:hypothetical protein SPRG_18437 [Saprolegnia parasitica CBS 223.65]KDO16028.1 hypothetical protein SPRG_18437 [Saprolegnia parasitica CBS 223.65]|eukprot:XP_012213265.1 hypothetical protein SPRG_18437 [Saprolegnia parasitica CBS 223.65]